ncbi:MAG: tRNA (cytidine(56)-2'-O)-methyltransferase [Candidatus Bathyarchaeota archaeon]|nr:MAG: tRNA (cytidine(56)-2'-O)-methyltransferase [Candidatus Bathyarchaeota archaeon]
MVRPQISVLRLGHRVERDERATMHVLLASRALSVSEAVYSGQRDKSLEERIQGVVDRWGGPFEVKYERDWRRMMQNWKERGVVCHLTMYGININECFGEIPKEKPVLAVVGSQKVHKDAFQLADYNIAIGNQPHSEIAALAIFLDRLFGGKGLKTEFEKGRMRVAPRERGKKVTFGIP